MVDHDKMLAQLELHEGVRLHVYVDTEGNDTLGIGYNVTARKLDEFEFTIARRIDVKAKPCITEVEARKQCRTDIDRVERAVLVHFAPYPKLCEVRQRVIVDMAFNLGFKALAFKQTADAIAKQDWSRAVRQMYQSKWSHQVGDGPGGKFDRCDRLSGMLLTGKDYTR